MSGRKVKQERKEGKHLRPAIEIVERLIPGIPTKEGQTKMRVFRERVRVRDRARIKRGIPNGYKYRTSRYPNNMVGKKEQEKRDAGK